MRKKHFLLLLFFAMTAFAQESKKPAYDEALAKKLNADSHGMRKYIFCLLKSGTNTTATQEEIKILFEGHMASINKMAADGKLSVAGPFGKNDRNYKGIYIFNVNTIEEAQALTENDPAIKAKLLEAEFTLFYCTAALQEIPELHEKIAKEKY
ncbi:MAG: hypothetical protein CFE23_03160 [Flavobacterium sp. BFFFF1]|uniref:YciI family protein n=1 Tax=unclassified Flavobacterium TaxID=196869 RepID=UPI000BD4489A|nr:MULTISPECIES: YciI family protein [unclassified Flavobacterium]OYU81887.1 MAG: hypothetical protein CFE23_03160 [Flavobacterium sp. BFFFF1]